MIPHGERGRKWDSSQVGQAGQVEGNRHNAFETLSVNASTGPITFTVGDVETATGSLIVSSDSSNRTLVPTGTISFGEGRIAHTVGVTPPLHQTGVTTITVTVTDGELSAHDTFVLTVEGHVVYRPLALRTYR